MLQLLLILIVSIILNLFCLLIIKSGLTGMSLNAKLSNLLENKIYLFFTVPFFISLLILIYLNNSVRYLEDKDIVVTTVVQNAQFPFSGDTFNLIFNKLGSAAVFRAGARIDAGLVSKYPMHLLPKTGIIGGIAAGFTVTFKVKNNTFPVPTPCSSSIETGEVTVKLEGLTMSKSNSNTTDTIGILQKNFGTHNIQNSNVKMRDVDNKLEVFASQDQSTSVIGELDRDYPNWKDGFINSPLEDGDLDSSIKLFLIETLTNN